jgi:hypothetical protein
MKNMIVPEWMGKVVYFALGFMVCFTLFVKDIV